MRPTLPPRLAALAALAAVLAGCSVPGPAAPQDPFDAYLAEKQACEAQPAVPHTLYLGPGNSLLPEAPAAGEAPGNGFRQGFLTNDLLEWLGAPVTGGLLLEGTVEIELWVRSEGTPAPILGTEDPGTGYHLFNQFGSNRSLQPAYAVEYDDALPADGSVAHYNETLPLEGGGFVLEPGDRVRLLLTGLTLDGPDGPGQSILYGGATPSQVRFTARCWLQRYGPGLATSADVAIQGNQGLFTGAGGIVAEALPAPGLLAEGVHRQTVGFTLIPGVARLTIDLRQTGDPLPPPAPDAPKADMDLVLADAQGNELWPIGSPYSDEHGVLWAPNLASLPPGSYAVVVNAYSGAAYTGVLTITQERALERPPPPASEPA